MDFSSFLFYFSTLEMLGEFDQKYFIKNFQNEKKFNIFAF